MNPDFVRTQWVEDMNALIVGKPSSAFALNLWTIHKHYMMHCISEQLTDHPDSEDFPISLCGVGTATLHRNGDSWEMKDFQFCSDFLSSLKDTVRCKESPLLRSLSSSVVRTVTTAVEQYSKS